MINCRNKHSTLRLRIKPGLVRLSVIAASIFLLVNFVSAEEGEWFVSLSPGATTFLSGNAGSGSGAPKYRDSFDTGYGITAEVQKLLSSQAGIRGGIGFESYSGKNHEGLKFNNLDIIPVYVGGIYSLPLGAETGLNLTADIGTAHLSSVDISSENLGGPYWNASWVFLCGAGAGLEYHSGRWGVSLKMNIRYLGKPDSAIGIPSDAGSSWSLPIGLAVRYSF